MSPTVRAAGDVPLGGRRVRSVATAPDVTCVLFEQPRRVRCWGAGATGILVTSAGGAVPSPPAPRVVAARAARSLS